MTTSMYRVLILLLLNYVRLQQGLFAFAEPYNFHQLLPVAQLKRQETATGVAILCTWLDTHARGWMVPMFGVLYCICADLFYDLGPIPHRALIYLNNFIQETWLFCGHQGPNSGRLRLLRLWTGMFFSRISFFKNDWPPQPQLDSRGRALLLI